MCQRLSELKVHNFGLWFKDCTCCALPAHSERALKYNIKHKFENRFLMPISVQSIRSPSPLLAGVKGQDLNIIYDVQLLSDENVVSLKNQAHTQGGEGVSKG